MSFSRAKITRFNEAVSNTPSPADYNVKTEKAAKHGVITKCDRFVDKSPVRSECPSLVGSAHSSPCFRTPTIPKKKKTIFAISGKKNKPKNKKTLNDETIEDDALDFEALKDKIVECNNKDVFIKDLTEQIEEMRVQINNLDCQKELLTRERCKYEDQCNELRMEHKITLQNAFLQYDTETNALNERIKILEYDLIHEQETVKQLHEHAKVKEMCMERVEKLAAQNSKLEEMWESRFSQKQSTIDQLQVKISTLKEQYAILQSQFDSKLHLIQKKHKDEMVDMEFSMLKSITETQNLLDKEKSNFDKKITALCSEHEKEKNKLAEEANAKITQMEENTKEANLLADIQMQERCKDIEMSWKLALEKQQMDSAAILKECQAISEYTITQCEVEKNEIIVKLQKKTDELQNYERENADLNIAFQKMSLKYDDLVKEVEEGKHAKDNELEKYKQEVQDILQQKKLYEISIKKSHYIIDTLTKRLLDSDHDVEQLKSELETSEASKIELEAKWNTVRDELYQSQKRNKEIEAVYHDMLKKTDDRIAALEIELIAMVEDYKAYGVQQINNLVEQLIQKNGELQEAFDQLHVGQMFNQKAQELIEKADIEFDELSAEKELIETELADTKEGLAKVQRHLEETENQVSDFQIENAKLQQELIKITQENGALTKQMQQVQEKCDAYSQYCDYYKLKATDYETEIEELDGINKKYIDQSGKYDALLNKFELLQVRCSALEEKTSEQDALIGPFREQLEAYDLERNALVCQKDAAESEARTIGLKYAQLLGHQNQKQKIKHMMDLKAKNYELVEEKKDLEIKVKSQMKTIEKLTKQLSAMQLQSPRKSKIQSTDKENMPSPNRTLNNSRVESPGPLKERN